MCICCMTQITQTGALSQPRAMAGGERRHRNTCGERGDIGAPVGREET